MRNSLDFLFNMRLGRNTLWILLLACAIKVAIAIAYTYPRIVKHEVFSDEGHLRLQARADVSLSDEMLKALEHNVALEFVWRIKIERIRPWYVWDKDLYDRELTRNIFLNRSQGMYALSNPDTNRTLHYRSFADAIRALGSIDIIKMVAVNKLRSDALYNSSIRFEIKTSSLPAIMYLRGVFSKEWKFDTGWDIKKFKL